MRRSRQLHAVTSILLMKKVLITGSQGLLGYHAKSLFFAENCARKYSGNKAKWEIVESPRLNTENYEEWKNIAKSADLILHFAGINRSDDQELEFGNARITEILVNVLEESSSKAHVMYANSTHSETDTPYGRGKFAAHILLDGWASRGSGTYTNFVVPHIFGEGARPFYNNVTGTLCHQVINAEPPTIHAGAKVELLHAGLVVESMLTSFHTCLTGTQRLHGTPLTVQELYDIISDFHSGYSSNMYPELHNDFIVALYNTYRYFAYPNCFPIALEMHNDVRGSLFEAVKGGGGGQTFLSWTQPGAERGNHFHRYKVERFLVLSGKAEIKVRSIFEDKIDRYNVTGESPAYIDMPTLHTHSIVNTGSVPLLTLFWAHEIFDPSNPDTYAIPVDVK